MKKFPVVPGKRNLTIRLPEDVWTYVKICAAEDSDTIVNIVTECLKEYRIKREKNKLKRK